MNDDYCRYIECLYCGHDIMTRSHHQKFCNDVCRAAYVALQYVPIDFVDTAYNCAKYEVIKDALPVSDGGFVPNSRLGSDQSMMCLLNNEALTSGSIIRNLKSGQKYMIRYPEKKRKNQIYVIAECLIPID